MRAGKKALRFAAAALMGLSLMACGGAKQSASVSEPVEINLSEKSGQEEVSAALAKAGIPESDIREFQREVERFQTAVGDATTEDDMADRWEKAYPDFVGTNCRITAFMLGNSLVKVDGGSGDGLSEKENLAFDMEALQKAPETLWDSSQNDAFARLFAEVPAADTKDVAEQVKQVQKAWKERGISFADGKASLVTVWLHSKITPEENILFPGHVGVLIQEDGGKLLFVEKLAFQKQYRALYFENRASLNAYLMGLYDLDENQPTAHTFLMENDKLMQDYSVVKKGA